MGRCLTPKYRVEFRDNVLAMGKCVADHKGHNGKPCLSHAWHGKPSYEALTAWRDMMNKSFKIGECNGHLTEAIGFEVHIHTCAIVRQKDGMLMFKYDAPMFEVV